MTQGLGEYTFLPWLRQGLAQSIDKVDGDQTVKFRATTRVQLKVTGAPMGTGTLEGTPGRDVELYGPGEVIGIDQRLIIRTDGSDSPRVDRIRDDIWPSSWSTRSWLGASACARASASPVWQSIASSRST